MCFVFFKPLIALLFTVSYMLVTPQGGSLHYCVFKHSEWAKKVMNGIFSFLDNLLMALRAGYSRLDCNDRHAPVDRSIHPHQHRLHCEDIQQSRTTNLFHTAAGLSGSERRVGTWRAGTQTLSWTSGGTVACTGNRTWPAETQSRETETNVMLQVDTAGKVYFFSFPWKITDAPQWDSSLRREAQRAETNPQHKLSGIVENLCTCWWFTGG